MRISIKKTSTNKSKPSSSQSPLHKKKIFKFVNENANSKNERSLQVQIVHDRFIEEPPKENKEDFRIEIERRYRKAVAIQQYQFPKQDISLDSLSNSSQDSLTRLEQTCTYDLHSQNLRFFAKQQKANKKQASDSRNETLAKENQANRANVNQISVQAQKIESTKKIQKANNENRCKTSPDSRRVLQSRDENTKYRGKDQSATKKITDSTEKRPVSALRLQKDTGDKFNESISETGESGATVRKILVNTSPKQINFSLNAHGSDKAAEVNSSVALTKSTNYQHSLKDSKTMSKSLKDLSSALKSPILYDPNAKVQSPVGLTKKVSGATPTKTISTTSPIKNISTKVLTRNVKNSIGQTLAKSKDSISTKLTADLSNFLSEKSPTKTKNNEPERYFSVKSTTDSKASESRSFVSVLNTEEQASSRGTSREKLKMTASLYNKAQNNLLLRQQASAVEKANTASTELPQGGTTINIRSFLQGSFTTTNREKISKTPVRSVISPRMHGNTPSTSTSTVNTSLYLKKPDLRMSFGKCGGSNSKPTPSNQSEAKPVSQLQQSIEKSVIQKQVVTTSEFLRAKTPKHASGNISSVSKTPSGKSRFGIRDAESGKLSLDLRTGALSERNKENSRLRGVKKVITEWEKKSLGKKPGQRLKDYYDSESVRPTEPSWSSLKI